MLDTTRAALNLPNSQVADVAMGDVAGRDVVNQGVDGDQVVELLGGRLASGLDRIGTVMLWFLPFFVLQTVTVFLVVVLALSVLYGPRLIAGL